MSSYGIWLFLTSLLSSHKISYVLAHGAPATLGSFLFLKPSLRAPAPSPLYLLFFYQVCSFYRGLSPSPSSSLLKYRLHETYRDHLPLSSPWESLILLIHLIFSFFSFFVSFPPLECKLHVGEDFCWFVSLLYLKCLVHYLLHSRCAVIFSECIWYGTVAQQYLAVGKQLEQ